MIFNPKFFIWLKFQSSRRKQWHFQACEVEKKITSLLLPGTIRSCMLPKWGTQPRKWETFLNTENWQLKTEKRGEKKNFQDGSRNHSSDGKGIPRWQLYSQPRRQMAKDGSWQATSGRRFIREKKKELIIWHLDHGENYTERIQRLWKEPVMSIKILSSRKKTRQLLTPGKTKFCQKRKRNLCIFLGLSGNSKSIHNINTEYWILI